MMGYPQKSDQLEVVSRKVVLLGTGAAVPTKVVGAGITVTRTGVGVYVLTWREYPGSLLGLLFGFHGATPAGNAGFSVVATTPAAGAKALTITVYDETFAAADLAATQYLTLNLDFSKSSSVLG